MQCGAVAVVLAALPFKPFDLDRFFVPKELVLHLTAAAVALCLSRTPRRVALTLPDAAIALFLLLGALSATLATNHWLAARALAISVSGATLFWGARAVARAGLARPLVAALAAATALAALTSLLQAYGVETEYFSLNRAPGGTFGNRNFVAHLSAVGLPLVVLYALTARGSVGALLGAIGAGLAAAALVLSRSRGAWLAVAATALPAVVALWRARRLEKERSGAGRRVLLGLAAGAGVAAALLLPNTLNWKSDSPYLDSVRGVVDYRQGSGHGRLVQYHNTLRIAFDHPLLGVGPGNWPVWYPRYASPGDPSLTDDAMTANPWPSSDWAATVAERGIAATLLLALVFLAAGTRSLRGVFRARRAEELVAPAALGAVLLAALVVGAFDAVLLLAAPALVVWTALGALWPDDAAPVREGARARRTIPLGDGAWRRVTAALAFVGLFFAVRSTTQLASMAIVGTGVRTGALGWAAAVDPGAYRVHLWLARNAASHGRCGSVSTHAAAANLLFPSAPEPRRLLGRCGVSVPRPETRPGR